LVAPVERTETLVPVAAPRLALYRQLFGGARFDAAAYFGSYPLWLPFRLGETQAEAAVPYVLSDALVNLAEQATQEWLDFVRRRKEGEPALEVAIYLENQPRRLPPVRLYPGRLTDGSFMAKVIHRALRSDPLLDAGLVEAWLARGGPAALFVESLAAAAQQALELDLAASADTPYLYVLALACVELVGSLKRFPKAIQIRAVSYDRLEKATGLLFCAVIDEVFERVLRPLPSRGLSFGTVAYALRIRLALNPLAFGSIRQSILFNDVNPYGISNAWAALLEPLFADLLGGDRPREVETRLHKLLAAQRELTDGALAMGRVAHLREAVLAFLTHFDAFDPVLTAELAAALPRDEDLVALPARAKALCAAMAPLQGRKLSHAEALSLEQVRAALRSEVDEAKLVSFAAMGFLGLALDHFAVGHVDRACARLRNRRGDLSPQRIDAEYAQGRLYRFGGDGLPVLRSAAAAQQGHLFIDLKGFTQRTYRAKEVVMAEFMRTEFYAPILKAAQKQRACADGDGQPALVLQNLLGDAAVFSGDVRALVQLARDIQLHLAGYAETLRARLGATADEVSARLGAVRAEAAAAALELNTEQAALDGELLRKRQLSPDAQEELLWDLYARRAFALERRRTQAELAGLGAEVDRLRRAEAQLQRERAALDEALETLSGAERQAHVDERICAPERARRAEIQRELKRLDENTKVVQRALEEEARSAQGYGLEAGLFVTYGAAAERIDIDDPVFGHVNVAIAEKINEAARGTARSPALRSKLDALLARARVERPQLSLPFGVYVDQTYSVVLSPELTAQVDAAIAQRDAGQVARAVASLADGVQHDVARMMGRADPAAPGMLTVINDIYNVGEAFSEEAVAAFLRETRATRFAFRRGLQVSELHPDFRGRFLFIDPAVDLHVSVPLSGDLADARVFRLAGHVHFRGFEAKRATAVYELLRPSAPFLRLLAHHHLRAWLDEARAGGSGRPSSSPG